MRFTGTVEEIGPVDAAALAAWIAAIPFEEWPQQTRIEGQLRPAMVTDLAWRGFYTVAKPLVQALDLGRTNQWMLSAVMGGHDIPPHRDEQAADWLYRVHVPLLTNEASEFVCGGLAHRMLVGIAYKVNTLAEHAVYNRGASPRVHFMFDVMEG